jgi:hypothetical protein
MAENSLANVTKIDNGFVVRYVEVLQRQEAIMPSFGSGGPQLANMVANMIGRFFANDPDAGEAWKAGQQEDRVKRIQADIEQLQKNFAHKTQPVWHIEPRVLFCPTMIQVQECLDHANLMLEQLARLQQQGTPIRASQAVAVPLG